MGTDSIRIGVLALQGAFREHVSLLRTVKGVTPVEVRTVQELFSVSGLIIPGGESTTISLVAQRWGLLDALIQFRQEGRPVWGTCAGLILLAERAEGTKQGGQSLIGGLDVLVVRNFFGAQADSFETTMDAPSCLAPFGSGSFRGVFIRAPAITEVGEGVEVLCQLQLDERQKRTAGRSHVIVAVKSQSSLATAFHPELTGDNRWHQLFAAMVIESGKHKDVAVLSPSEGISSSCRVPSDLPIYGKCAFHLSES